MIVVCFFSPSIVCFFWRSTCADVVQGLGPKRALWHMCGFTRHVCTYGVCYTYKPGNREVQNLSCLCADAPMASARSPKVSNYHIPVCELFPIPKAQFVGITMVDLSCCCSLINEHAYQKLLPVTKLFSSALFQHRPGLHPAPLFYPVTFATRMQENHRNPWCCAGHSARIRAINGADPTEPFTFYDLCAQEPI